MVKQIQKKKYHMSCSSCHLDLRSTTFVKCAECIVPSVELCFLCFSGKFQRGLHIPSHAYHVLNGEELSEVTLNDHVIGKQLVMIDSSRKFSVGSWAQCSERSSMESSSVCEEQFMRNYMCWYENSKESRSRQEFHIDTRCLKQAEGPLGPRIAGISPSPPPVSDLPGFIRNRCDFEVEYDDSAELAIADLEITDDDTQEDLSVKLECLRSFSDRLLRREEIKMFLSATDLTYIQGQIDLHRCRTAEEIETRGKLRPVERHVQKLGCFEEFVQMLLYEQRLRNRLQKIRKPFQPEGESDINGSVKADIKDEKMNGDETLTTTASGSHFTRSRSASEQRRGRSVDEECARILEIAYDGDVIERIGANVTATEGELVQHSGLDQSTYSVIRDAIQKSALIEGVDSFDLSLSKFGNVISIRSST